MLKTKNDGESVKSGKYFLIFLNRFLIFYLSDGIVLEVISGINYNQQLNLAYAIATDGILKCHIHFPLADKENFSVALHDVVYMENVTSSFGKLFVYVSIIRSFFSAVPKNEIYGKCADSLRMFTILSNSQPVILDDTVEVEDYENVKDLLFPEFKKVL